MNDNSSNHKKPKNNLDNIDDPINCLYCGKDAVPYAYSKYSINPEISDLDVYICDDCESIFVIEDDQNGNVTRHELSRDYLRSQKEIPF